MLAKSTMQPLPFALANCTGTKCNGLAANEDDKIATKYNMQKKQCFTNSKYYLERAGLEAFDDPQKLVRNLKDHGVELDQSLKTILET